MEMITIGGIIVLVGSIYVMHLENIIIMALNINKREKYKKRTMKRYMSVKIDTKHSAKKVNNCRI